MQDRHNPDFPPDLSSHSRSDWLTELRRLGDQRGFSEPLGSAHAGVFIEEGDTLLVSFETMASIEGQSRRRTPLGFDIVASLGWSSLSLLSRGDTWFRDPKVYTFFDHLLDDGFFDDFDTVIFYGAGPCGYAAAAYSVAAPGARVLLLEPQATLDPRVTEWDDRFARMRRQDFTSRYGFAPEMLEAAQAAHVVYDPHEPLDAMHAALFRRDNVQRFRAPFMGGTLQADLRALELLEPMLDAVARDSLDPLAFATHFRARRDYRPYLRRLLARLDDDGRTGLAKLMCLNVAERIHAPRFRRRLEQLEAG